MKMEKKGEATAKKVARHPNTTERKGRGGRGVGLEKEKKWTVDKKKTRNERCGVRN